MPRFGDRLGEILIDMGVLSETELNKALAIQRVDRTGKLLGEILIEEGFITEEDLGEALYQQTGYEYIQLADQEIDRDVLALVDEDFARRKIVMPIQKTDNRLVVAIGDPNDVMIIDDLRTQTGMEIRPCVSNPAEIKRTIEITYGRMQPGGPSEQEEEEKASPPLIQRTDDLGRKDMTTIHTGTILIVEDQVEFRRIYHDVLESGGYNILEAEDGASGWELVKTEKPDLILLDLILPKLHGFELLKKIRADETTKEIPVIILSVLGEKENIQKGLELGANDYMVKGYHTPREILSKIPAFLGENDTKDQKTSSYTLSIVEGREDALKLWSDIGLTEFRCPQCNTTILLKLVPLDTHADGHWFLAHLVCPICEMTF
ncbi:MAG: response regulator [Candidatus Bipolaricaulia bacterium]